MHFDDNMWVLEDMANMNMKKLMKGMTATLSIRMVRETRSGSEDPRSKTTIAVATEGPFITIMPQRA